MSSSSWLFGPKRIVPLIDVPPDAVVEPVPRERFDAVVQHPAYAEAMAWTPPPSRWPALAGAGWIIYIGAALVWFAWTHLEARQSSLLMTVAGACIAACGIVAFVRILLRFRAPVRRVIVRVVSARTRSSGGGNKHPASITYHATLDCEDGHRLERRASSDVAGALAAGSLGVAYLRGLQLVAFRRFDV